MAVGRIRTKMILDEARHRAFFNGKGMFEGKGLYNIASGYLIDMPQRDELCAPMLAPRFQEYESIVSGKWISDRRERRYDLESTESYEMDPPKKKRGYVSPFFAKKFNQKLDPSKTLTGDPFPERELARRGIDPDTVKNQRAENRAKRHAKERENLRNAVRENLEKDLYTRKQKAAIKESKVLEQGKESHG